MRKTILSETKSTLKIALPIIVGQLGVMLMGVADTIQVGHMALYAKENVGAGAIGNGVFITIAIIGLLAVQIAAPMIAHKIAEQKKAEQVSIFHSVIAAALLLSVLCYIIIEILVFNFHWLGQNPQIAALAKPYTHVIALSVVPSILFTALRQLSDGHGETKIAMIITLVALVLNIILNHLFIYGAGFIPAMGLFGAGLATLICRILMVLALYFYLAKKYKSFFPILQGSKSQVLYMLKIGVPSGFQGFFEIAVFAYAAVLMGQLGATQLAAHQVAINPASLTYMMVTGLATAGGIRVGRHLDHPNALRRAGFVALGLAFVFMAICGIVFLVANAQIAALYIADIQVQTLAKQLLIIAALFQLSDGLQAVALGILRGMADVNLPTLITVVAYWVVGLPFGYFLAFNQNMGAAGIWYGLTLGLTASAILLCTRFYFISKKSPKNIK
jgi:multidrug resistance protein, MATE family